MSIDMYLSSSDGQATSTSETCRKQIRGYEELQQAIHDLRTNRESTEVKHTHLQSVIFQQYYSH
ncbi:hypothetical protein KKC_08962 [Listeria fleischmannii subsp. coloradonensis]|uniref:hypothetical protein n=1 Tax=Listeria fleischmannii TaxID=1069827 RepID=UPI000254F6E3|nr:hypothetical protein [Listeria fleischmannii]EIA20083.1 hypothetical protein KKC_08962 [Listeria fleischmannii subsp. coloradonensis]